MAQHHNPRIVTDGLIYHLDPTNGGKGGSKVIAKPTQIDGCVMWMDADDRESVVMDSSTVGTWLDKSGSGYHWTPLSSGVGPTRTNKRNSRDVLTFATTDNLRNTSFTSLYQNDFTGFVVSRYTTSTGGRILQGISGNFLLGHWSNSAGKFYSEGFVSSSSGSQHNFATWQIQTGDADYSADRYRFYRNGKDSTDSVTAGAGGGPSGVRINGYEDSACEVAEIIFYSRRLSRAERESVELYLSRKWAIPLQQRSLTNLADGVDVGDLCQNGGFDSDTSWTHSSPAPGSGTAISGGIATVIANGDVGSTTNNMVLRQHVTNMFEVGRRYRVSFDVRQTVGSGNFQMGSGYQVHFNQAVTGTMTNYSFPVNVTSYVNIYSTFLAFGGATSGDTFELDNVVVMEVFDEAKITHNNTLYFENPANDNSDIRVFPTPGSTSKTGLAIADNLPWTMEFWIKRHKRGDVRSTYDGIWGNKYASSEYERLQFDDDVAFDKLMVDDGAGTAALITNGVDIDCLHKWRHVVLAFDGTTDATTAGCVRQYVDGSDKGPAIAWPFADSKITIKTIGSRGHPTDAHRLEGELGNFRVYDKQLSHAEVLQNYNAQRAKYENKKMSFVMLDENTLTSDFSAGTDGWGAGGGGVAGNIDSIGGQNDCLRFTCNSSTSVHYMLLAAATHGASVGDSVRITFDYYVPSGQSHVDGIGMGIYGPTTTQPYYSTMNTTDAWTSVDVTFEVTQAYGFIIYGYDGGVQTFTDTGNDVFYIRNFKYHRPPGGLRLYLDAQSGTSSNYYANGDWYDISGGTAYNATRANATFTDEGTKYYAFDGTGDYFDANAIEGVFAEVTFSLWMFKSAQTVSFGNIFDCSWDTTHWNRGPRLEAYGASADPSRVTLYAGSDAGSYSTTATNDFNNDEWVQVTYTIKTETNIAGSATSQTIKAYVDGVLNTENVNTTNTSMWGWDGTVVNPTIPNFVLGRGYDNTRYFTGGIANCMIYDTVLSADQVMQNYNYFKHRFGK